MTFAYTDCRTVSAHITHSTKALLTVHENRPRPYALQIDLLALDGETIAEAAAYIIVEAVNDAPSIASPAWTVVLEEDAGPTNIPGVYMTDPDAHETPQAAVEVQIPAAHAHADNIEEERALLAGLDVMLAF